MEQGRHVILCIDDDPDILASLRVVLEAGGYDVVTATNAADAIRAFQGRRPDLIILDLMMEQIDSGMRVMDSLRASGSEVPVYILSSTGDYLHGAADVTAMGVTGVFQKPIDPALLLALLRQKLGPPGA